MPSKVKHFYELQQKASNHWAHVGYYTTKKRAEKSMDEFNTKILINPLRVLERTFIK